MRKWILILTLLAVPAFAQRARVDSQKAFRQDLAAAVGNGSLTAEEKQKYDAALKTLDAQRAARKAGQEVDRAAGRQAMKDLTEIAHSSNLKEDDRAKLAKHMQNTHKGKGKGAKRKPPAA